MSEEISTLEEGKVITSLAAFGEYRLAVHDKDNVPNHFLFIGSDKAYGYEEYCDVLRALWEGFVDKCERPKLLGLPISDYGFVEETLHCIAPGGWGSPSAPPLAPCRESFVYWLISKSPEIQATIGQNEFDYLNRELESILQIHLGSKQKLESRV